MKLFILLSLLSLNVLGAQVECTKEGRYYRPTNELAKKIATSLGVKTCTGENFKKVVKAKQFTVNFDIDKVATKKMSVEDVIKGL